MILKIYDLREPVSPVMSFHGVTSFSVEEKCNQTRVLEVKFWGDDETDSVKVGLGEYLVGEDPPAVFGHGYGGLVAGGFHRQDEHGDNPSFLR